MPMRERADLDIASLLGELRRRARLVVAIAIVAAGLAFGLSQLQSDRYVATADLLFRSDPNAYAPERAAATNLELASTDSVLVNVRRRLGLNGVPTDELRERVDLQPVGQADLLQVKASGTSPMDAARLANAFAVEIVAVRRETAQAEIQRMIDSLDAKLAQTGPDTELTADDLAQRRRSLLIDRAVAQGQVEVIDEASPPQERAAPRPIRNAVIGGVLGFVLALMLVVLLRAFDRRMSDEEAVELFGAPILAGIPVRDSKPWRSQLFDEAFQFLRANVVALFADQADTLGPRELRQDSQGRVLVVTSPLPANGKSTTVARLGEALATSGARVLAIDGDMRNPKLGPELGLSEGHRGLSDGLVGSATSLPGLIQPTAVSRLSVLPGGMTCVGPGMPIASPRRLLQVVNALRYRADIVLIDTAPVAIAAETSVLAGQADGVIVVLDARNLDRPTLTATRDQLRRAGAEVIGLVINFAESANERVLKSAYGAPYRAPSPPVPAPGGADDPPAPAEDTPRSAPQPS